MNHAENNRRDVTWIIGLVLIGLGVAFLLDQFVPLFSWVRHLFWIVVLAAGSAAFYSVYLRNKEQWWPLIPAYALAAGALLNLLGFVGLGGDFLGGLTILAVAAPFFYVYLRNKENWWALIPGGILAMVGLGLLISSIAFAIPALMIVGGVYLLVRQLTGKNTEDTPSAPKTGPEADKPPSK